MRQKGKYGREWDKARAQWFDEHPGEWFYCSLRISPKCPGATPRGETTLDHDISRTRDPSLRIEQSNLQPACQWCNELKGSRSTAEVKAIYGVGN